MRRTVAALAVLVFVCAASGLEAQSLRGSSWSLTRQNRQARAHDFTYLRTSAGVRKFVQLGLLVPVRGNADYDVARVSFPYARPELKLFIERLAAQYRAACGEELVVTSLTRPTTRQPRNASDRSVHPTGMAADLRRSRKASCRRWLERVLLDLEAKGVLEATRERRPPHYHVAVFPGPYGRYVAALRNARTEARLASSEQTRHRVNRGDTLWDIARRYGTTVEDLKAANGLRTARIVSGQVLVIPRGR